MKLTDEIREKLAKVYNLIKGGATDGEKAAAQKALDRIIEKYNLDIDDLESLSRKEYVFKYCSNLEVMLLGAIMQCMTDDAFKNSARVSFNFKSVREIRSSLTYIDWVTIESAYEYFRRHMKKEWQRVCVPELNRCRKDKIRRKLRKELEVLFINRYTIESKLYREGALITLDAEKMSKRELKNRMKLTKVEGGEYNRQVNRGLYLDNN